MSALVDSLHSPLFRRAVLEAVLVGVLCGVVGVHVALRRMSFFVVAVSHGTFPGVVVASLVGFSLFLGGVGAAVFMIAAILLVGRSRSLDESGAVGVVLAGSFAVGVLLLSASPGQSRDLSAFLVGQILSITGADIGRTVVVGLLIAAALVLLHKELVAGAFDPTGATSLGYPVAVLDAAAMGIAAVALVTAIPAVGTILAVALLTVPALAARQCTDRIPVLVVLAAGIGALSAVTGMAASTLFGVAAGGAIALSSVGIFGLCFGGRRVMRHTA